METGWIFGCFQGNMSVYQENRRGREGGKEREVKRCRGAAIGTLEWHRTIVESERTMVI